MLIRCSTASKLIRNSIQCCSKSSYNTPRLIHRSARLFNEDSSDNDRPEMFHLEHVQKRLEHCVSLMFRDKLDFTFYRKDVILDDHIFMHKSVGLDAVVTHLSTINFGVTYLLPYARLEALHIIPILEDGTVRLRWRVEYQNWFTALSLRNIMGKLDFEKSVRWYDGYSIFFVDGNGLVSKFTLQKSIPNDHKTLTPKNIAEKIVQKATPATTNSSTATKL